MQLLLFLGAGVSKQSGLPTAADLTKSLLHRRSRRHEIHSRSVPPQQVRPADVVARIPRFLRLLRDYDEADIKRVGYSRAGKSGARYVSTTAIFRGGSTYEDLFFLCEQMKDWSRGWSANCLTTPLMEAIERRGGSLFSGRSKKARLSDVANVGAAACDFIESEVAAVLNATNPSGLELIYDLTTNPSVEALNIITLNHDTLVEQFLTRKEVAFTDGFGERDGDVRWYEDEMYDVSAAKARLFKLHGSIDWYRFGFRARTAVLLGSDSRNARDAQGNNLEVVGPGPAFLSGLSKQIAYQRGVYADLHHRFHELLRKCRVMVMSGYGWGDHAINCRLEAWLDDPRQNKLILLHPSPEDLTWRSLIVVTSFDGWVRSQRLIQIRKWLCDVRGDDLADQLVERPPT